MTSGDNAALFRLAEAALPGAGLGGYSLPEDARLIFAEGSGARFRDADGREFADYVCGAGALIWGIRIRRLWRRRKSKRQEGRICSGR